MRLDAAFPLSLAFAFLAASPVVEAQAPKGVPTYRETPDDAPRRTTLPRTGPAIPVAGGFTSVQVNVDLAGLNIVGDAANEPSLAVDPNDPQRIVVGWRQFDSVQSNFRQAGWAYSHDGGATWRFPGRIEPGVFRSDPVLDVSPTGEFYYYSLEGDFTTDLFISEVSGVAWNQKSPNFGGDKNWMAVDRTGGQGDGHLYFAWSRFAGCCGSNTFTRSTDFGQTFLNPLSLNALFGTLAVAKDGTLFVAGLVANPFDGGSYVVAKSTTAKNSVIVPTFSLTPVNLGGSTVLSAGPNPGGLLGQVWVATGPSPGDVYVLASVDPPGPDPLDVHFVRSTDGGLSWSAPVRVNDDPVGTNAWQWFGTMSVAPNGRIDVIWNDTRNDATATFSELHYTSSTDGGQTWAANVVCSPPFNHFLGYPNQNKLGDYYDMISDDVGAHVAWAATFNGEQDVYYLRIGPNDCNGNGTDDALDIGGGTSQDTNSNQVPDECEGPILSKVTPPAAGQTNTVHVTRARKNGSIFLAIGVTPATLAIGGCFNAPLLIQNPILAGPIPTDATGHVTLSAPVPASAAGGTVLLQAIDPGLCDLSDVVKVTF